MNINLELLLKIAIEASLEAGDSIMAIYESDDFDVTTKGDDSPLTRADLSSHNIIKQHLEKTEIPILSEEGKAIAYEERKDWDLLWIVDPIDGTKEFIKKNGEFTVNIALVQDQKPILGVVYAPAINTIYFSSKDIGAFKNDEVEAPQAVEEIKASAIKLPVKRDDDKYVVVASKSHMSPETQEYIDELEKTHGKVETISKGSSLKMCMVADGTADCYPRFAPTMEWDTAAGNAICIGAGKTVLDWETKQDMVYNRKELLNNWFLVR